MILQVLNFRKQNDAIFLYNVYYIVNKFCGSVLSAGIVFPPLFARSLIGIGAREARKGSRERGSHMDRLTTRLHLTAHNF